MKREKDIAIKKDKETKKDLEERVTNKEQTEGG